MARFGQIITEGRMATYIEDPAGSLGRTGGQPPSEVNIGALDTPALHLTSSTQFISGRVVGPVDWDTTINSLGVVAFALDGLQADQDSITFDIQYQYIQAGVAALSDMNKTVSSFQTATIVTAEKGLVDESLYYEEAVIDRLDADNNYENAQPGGGFTFQFRIDPASSITSCYVVSLGVSFPLQGLDLGPVATF